VALAGCFVGFGGNFSDGEIVHRLKVRGSTAKSWLYGFIFAGNAREMGLGAYPAASVEAAREGRDRYVSDIGDFVTFALLQFFRCDYHISYRRAFRGSDHVATLYQAPHGARSGFG
jgi:hypothetical protein